MNAMVVGDQTLDTDAETGVFNLDNNIDTFLGVSLLGGAISAFKSAGYRTPKYMARKEMQRDDNDAARVFGNQEKWGGIRNTIAFGSDDEVQNMLEDVKSNPKYTEAQKRAALKYAGSVMKYRGMLDAEKKRRTEGYIDPIQNDAETSYDNGYSLETEKEKQDARNMYEYRRKQLLELTNEQSVADIDADPLGEIIRIAEDANWTPEERQVALDYVNAKATFDGMIERVRDDIDSQIAASDAMIDGRVNKTDGMIHPATMKVGDRKVYVVSGNINMNEDGTGIDLSKSDESILIRDAETGNMEFADPRSVLSLDEAMDAAKVKEEAQQNIRMTVAQKAADVIDGTLMFKPGEVYNVIDDGGAAHTITVVPVETAEGEVAPDEGIVTVSMDGAEPVQMDKADVQRMADNANLARLQQFEQQRTIERQQKAAQEAQEQYEAQRPVYNLNDEITIRDDAGNLVRGSVTAEENEDGQIEVYTESPINGKKIHMFTRRQIDDMLMEHNGEAVVVPEAPAITAEIDNAGAVQTEPSTVQNDVQNDVQGGDPAEEPLGTVAGEEVTVAVEPMPMLGEGEDAEPDFGSATPQRAHDYIFNESGLDEADAAAFTKNNVDAANKELEKIKNKKPKMGTSIAKFNKDKAEWERKVNEAQAKADYWKQVKEARDKVLAQRIAEQQERERQQIEQAQADEAAYREEMARKEAEQAALGSHNVSPAIREKWASAPKIEGAQDEIVLPNGEKVAGRYYLVESGAASASHDSNNGFVKTEGFPVDENGGSVNDRDYERDMDAQRITRDIANNYDSRAVQTPVVVSQDGVVLSGNGRTMAGDLAAAQNTDAAYNSHIAQYPTKWGFTKQQVEGMQHPRVVFVPDAAMPYTAETFAKFNQQEMKGQSKTEQAVKLGKVVSDKAFNRIIRIINRFDTLGDFYADSKATSEAIAELQGDGVLSQAQMAEMYDGEGISAIGKELLENTLIGKAFESNPNAVREITEFKSMRQSIITALAEISNNLSLGNDYSLESELAQAIDLVYQARKGGSKFGEPVSWFDRQQNLDFFGLGETVADYNNSTMLMITDIINDNRSSRLKKYLQIYNHNAQDSANGQLDLFTGSVHSKEDIINEVKQLFNNGSEEEQQKAAQEAVARRKAESVQENGTVANGSEAEPTGEVTETPDVSEGVETPATESPATEVAETATTMTREKMLPYMQQFLMETNGDMRLLDNMTDEELQKFLGLLDAWEEVNDTLGAAHTANDKYLNDKNKAIAKKAKEAIDAAEQLSSDAFVPVQNYYNELCDKYGITDEEEPAANATGTVAAAIAAAEAATEANPTDAQKEAGNYKKGHVKVDGFDITIENAKGSTRSGKDADGKEWSVTMNNTYGYIRGTEGVDGDHIDIYLSDDPSNGNVFVIDQVKADGTFDEHKVMYGFASSEEARDNYLANYSEGWTGLGTISEVTKDEFKKWVNSSHRKTKPFADYKNVKVEGAQNEEQPNTAASGPFGTIYTQFKGKAKEAIDWLKSKKEGEAAGALHHHTVGDISLVWGDAKTGLAKIVKKHPEVLDNLQDIIDSMEIVQESDNRIKLESDTHFAVVSKEYKGEPREKWLLTAYEKKETSEPANSRMDVESNLEGKSDDTATRQDSDVSYGKVTNNSASDQENGVKSYKISAFEYTTKRGKKLNMQLVTFESELSKEQMNAAKKLAKDLKGWWSKDDGGFLMRDADSAQQLAESVLGDEGAVADAQPVTLEDMKLATAEPASEEEEGFHGGDTVWSKQHGENKHILMAHHDHGAVQSYTFTDGTKAMAQDVEAAHEEPTPSADATGTVDDEKKGSGNKIVTDERYEQLKARMRKKLGQLNVSIIGIDPEMLAIGTEMAVYHIEKGARQFIPYAKAMIEDLGDAIRPYLKSFYNGARDLPEIEANGWTDEMTPYDEVRKIDVANFDQNTTNSMATADMVVKEEQAAQQAEAAKEQIIETRNNNRNEAEQQTETNTQAVADEAAAVASETESVVSSGDAAAISEQVSKIDEQLEKVNKQLALLGYYEADTEDPSKFHESYGYMKTAEKKAVSDALTFSRRLCKALGMTAIPKREVQANIAPIGGDVTFRIPLSDGKSLYFNIGLENDHGNLSLSRIMYRVEEKQDGAKYWNSVGHTNNYLPNDVTVDDAINDVKRMLRYDAPDFEIKEVPASTSAKQSKTTENKPKSKKKAVSLQQEQQLDLFGDLFSDLNEQTSETSNSNNNETTYVQSRTSEEGRGGYQPQQDAQVGRSTGHEAEGPDGQGMGGRSSSNTLSDGERSLGVSGIHQSKQHVDPAAEATGTVATENEGKTSGTVAKNTNNNHAERGKDYAPKGVDARIEANIKAIELMQQLMMEGKQATPAQMNVLRQYSGWGGLGKAFNEHPNGRYSTNPITNRLKELLGDEAFRLAEDSKDSAFYTPAVVIDAMWDIARALGFKGGTVLEGSAGIGNIIGAMPTDMSKRSDIHAVEIDETTGNILSLLYPDAKVDIQGFEQTKIANGSVDLAITNVPFVTGLNVRDESGDLDLSKKFKDIHDFCIAKNVRKLREGGIGIFITSSGTLDNSQKLRNWLVGEGGADVVGAFRLHNKTFGGAKVTSDIIVVRKRVNGQKSAHAIDVSTVTTERTGTFVDEKQRGKERTVSMDYNKYFMEHPECMAGEMFFGYEKGDNYRPSSKSLYPVNGKEQETMLAEWLKGFEGMKDEAQRKTAGNGGSGTEKQQDTVYESLGADVKEGSLILDKEGKLCVAQYGKAVPLSVNANKVKGHTKAECFQSYQAIKSALADVLAYQTENEGDEGLKPLLDKLNKAYDDFVKTYGHLHKNTSISFLKNDVDFPSVLALERHSEEGDKKGNKVDKFEKTDIFKQRVVEKDKAPEPKNVKDGIIASIYQYGRIDVHYIAEKLGKNVDDVKKEIVSSGLGFENPNTLQMEVSYEYLSGNVREKLRQAEEANEGGKYAANIEALRKVIPMDIPAHLIDFTLGSSWVEPKLYEDYIKERTDVDAQLTNVGGTWYMKVPYYVQHEKNKAMGVRGEVVKKLILGSELIEAALQNKTITVSETHSVGYGSSKTTESITDKEATQACAAKIDEIRADFKEWARQKMQSDPEMSARIEKAYNEQFNNYVPLDVSMEFVPEYFSGASHKFKMRPHQAKAIVRGTMQPLMLAHEVGTGKTFTLISTAMEMRRLGTAKKPMIVVQNATVGQFVESAKTLYPNAKVLTLDDKDHTSEGRKNFYAKIKYNDWDMVVVPQSVFERIPDSEERQMRFIQDKIDEKIAILEQMREADEGGKSSIVRQAEREIEQLKDQLGAIGETATAKRKQRDSKRDHITRQNTEVKAREMLDRETDDVENFDDMGIDALLVDEAHEYKHLGFATAMQRGVKGIDPSYSKKSQGVYLKTQAVLEKNNGRNVIFATGTPISNTAAEIWTFMRYLMPADTMKEYGIYYFDDFVRNFGNLTQMLEFTTNGKFKENNRFAGYVNLPELVRIWSSVADTVRTDEAQAVKDNVPDIEGGQAQDIYLPQTRALRSIMKFVKEELEIFERLSGKEKKKNSHIPLTMYGIAKAAAVDARLVMADAEDDPNSKTNEAVRQTLRSLKETAKYKGTVALFADNYQNKHSGFNLYDDIREKLIAQGVPADDVVVIRSGMTVKKKQEIFDKVNRGEIRVILGSTFTLGTGVNIQERLHTLIHLDAPNRPMDYTQRNGRIVRQGNLHKDMGIPVRVLRFGVQDSLDVTAYQRLKTKGAIADSIMKGKAMMQNSMEDRAMEEDEDVFGDTVAQLSGSQYAMLKNQAEREVRKYESKRKQWEADQTYVHNAIPRITAQIAESERKAAENNANLAKIEEAFGGSDKPAIKVGKHTFADIPAMADFFTEQNKKVKETEDEIRKSAGEEQRTRTVDVQIGNVIFTIKTTQKKELTYHGGTVDTRVSRSITISCPELGIEDMKGGAYFKNAMENIFNDVVSGSAFREDAAYYSTRAERLKGELELVKSREGQPFQYDKELEDSRQKLEEYTDLMKKEMEEKEKKYAEMDSDVEAATGVTFNNDEEEEDETLYRIVEDESPVYDSSMSEMMSRVNGLASSKSAGYSKSQYDSYVEREKRRMRQHAEHTASLLGIEGRVTIMETPEGLKGRKAKVKGWFDPKTGKIVIILSNHRSASDVVKTALHEGVAHYGLRALFGENFNQFLDNVFQHAEPLVRQRIVDLAKKHGWDFRTATEEYLAGLAEDTNFENAFNSGWWSRIKSLFLDMLRKIGLSDYAGPAFSDNELRYLLWRSYENLAEPGQYNNPFREAKDISMKMNLKVGEFEERKNETTGRRPVAQNGSGAENAAGSAAENNDAQEMSSFDKERARIHSLGKTDSSRWAREHAAMKENRGTLLRDSDPEERERADARQKLEEYTDLNKQMDLKVGNFAEEAAEKAIDAIKQRVMELFEQASSGEFTGKPKSIGRLSSEGKALLEKLSGQKFKEFIDFMLNPSDLNHIRGDHYGENEKDKGNNIPLNDEDIMNLVDVINQPDGILYGIDKKDGRKLFFFLKDAGNGLYNLTEVCSTKKGNITAKSFFKTKKKGINQRVMEITDSLLPTSVTYSGEFLSSGAKLPNLFDIQKDLDENVAEDDIFFRDGDPEERDRTDARYWYEQRVKSGMYQTREAMLDSMLGLHEAMKAIYGKDVHIEDIADFENAYLGENRLSSMNQDEWDCFEHLLIKPLLKEVSKLEKDGSSREEVTRYMMAKHGLERNEVMARRAAEQTAMDELGKDLRAAERAVQNDPLDQDALDALDDVKQRMQDRIDALYNENRERDYGGITGLMEEDDLGIAEGLARQLVEDFENNHDVNELWAKVNDVSKAILSKQYECGMMNKDTYDDISSMYEFYIPLRGFNEKTSEEAYAYLTNKNSAFNAPIKKAHGRKSVADDPIVNLQTMAQSSILMGNRNKLVKQRFLNFVLNHPSDLVSVNDLWIKYDDVKDEWTAVFPDNIEEDDSADVVEQKMRDFEEKMQQLEAADPVHYKRGKDAVNIPYRVVGDANLRQHQVLVKRNGRDYVITINGNPRAAQALNGLTNPDNRMSGSFGSIINTVGAINRTLSALYTTMSIDFVAGNFLRDTLYANTMVWIKESPRYARRYNKNYVKTKRVMQLLGKYRKGTLDMNNETEKMFYQFMKNGGETGYMRMADIDEHRKQIKKTLKAMNEKIPARMVRELVTTWIAEVGRGIEMRARFAAFITSREMGRSIGLSIWDAKEITVNFNKKGAGDKFIGATGQTFMGNTAAFVSGWGRAAYLFWNASLQGTFGNFGKYAMRHKGKAATAVALTFGLGLLITALAAASGDDDDDSYFDQPEHIRRQNIVFKLFGKTWGKIPLPIENRAVYGLGELAGCVIFNHEKLEYDKLAKQLSQVLPVDLLEGFDALLYPSAVKPAVEAANNESWYGTPIWKDTPYNKHMPEWTKSYKSTDQRLVALSETLNEMSGGSKYKKGAIDINPAKMEYLLKQYSGGLFTLANQLGSMYDVATGDKEFDWRYAPMLNRMFMTGGDERNAGRGLNEKFFRYMEAYDAKASEFSAIKNDLTIPMDKKAELISEIVSDPEYMKMRVTKNVYSKMNQAYKQAMELGKTEAADHLLNEMNKLKRKFIDEMEADDASK